MLRTQISLTAEERRALDAASARTGRSISALIAEEDQTRSLWSTLRWHPVDAGVAEKAGELGRAWLSSHRGIDSADLAIAATAFRLDARLLTINVRHFPMYPGIGRPY